MTANKHEGNCAACGNPVAANLGEVRTVAGCAAVYHLVCDDDRPRSMTSIFATAPVTH
jgi:hypothetical protein